MAILNNNPLVGASGNQGGYNINNSLRFRSSASAYLSRTPASAGNRKTWTWSAWIKPSLVVSTYAMLFAAGSTNGAGTRNYFGFDSSYRFIFGYGTSDYRVSTQVFRDPSAWYHIVVVFDSSNATAQNRIRVYINNVEITVWTTNNTVTLNQDGAINNNILHYSSAESGGYYLDGYLAEVNFIDGQALTPSSFGETDTTTGVWKPKAYSGTYGTNGFYLKFSDIATTSGSNAGLGKDFSGNTNYWTTNNISVTSGTTYDAMTDVPTNTSATVANYCVLNPLDKGTSITSSAGNLNLANGNAGNFENIRATFGMSAGKWYIEYVVNTWGANTRTGVGMGTSTLPLSGNFPGFYTNGWAYLGNGSAYTNNVATSLGTGTYTTGDVIMLAFDADNGNLWFGKNGTWNGAPASGTGATYTGLTSGPYFFTGWAYNTSDSTSANFGQRPFAYTPPTGFVALNTFNLPTPTILQGNKYMDATLWTGGQSSPFSVTNAGSFKPDLVWAKYRTAAASHRLYDSVRGSGISLYSNATSAEGTETNQGVSAFQTAGFQITNSNGVAPYLNDTSQTYVAWQWQAGQGSTSSNTSGSITSTVSVNTTAGFSIVTWTGNGGASTIGHGLGIAPKFIIVRTRNYPNNWFCYHGSLANTEVMYLDTTGAKDTSRTDWNSTSPTSSVFSVNGNNTNRSAINMLAYCWAEIAGFSRFGSYTGNGSADGPFVFTNLKPRFIMIKRTDSTSNWTILDTAREGYNVDNDPLYPNLSNAEGTTDLADILSNGFKLRSTDTSVNANAGTYIYACFSSNPFKNSTAV